MPIAQHIPPTLWLRLVLLLNRIKWYVKPLLRHFGVQLSMSWDEVILATKLLLPRIKAYDPDVVVGVGIGGTIWGGVLAGSLHDKPLLSVDRRVVRVDGERRVTLINPEALTENVPLIAGKKVLLVSAELVSAQTTIEARNLIRALNPGSIKIACIDYSPDAQLAPDFHYMTNRERIQKPWRAVPTYTNPDEPAR